MMSYRDCQAVLRYESEVGAFHGVVAGTRDVLFAVNSVRRMTSKRSTKYRTFLRRISFCQGCPTSTT